MRWLDHRDKSLKVEPWSEQGVRVEAALLELEAICKRLEVRLRRASMRLVEGP